MEDRKEAILKRLKHTVQLLASSAEMQLQMLPSYVFKADELALEFDRWRELTLGNYKSDLNAPQLSALTALHKKLEELTAGGEEYWTDEAIRTSREWQNVRGLAASVLNAFGWPAETPPSYAYEYIPPDPTPMVPPGLTGNRAAAAMLAWMDAKPLSETGKRIALYVIGVGIGTFFVPMVVLDPPVLNRAQWSPLQIALSVYERKLPASDTSVAADLIAIALVYALMPLALVAVYRPGPPRPLIAVSSIGFFLSGPLRSRHFWRYTFTTFGWEYFQGSGHIRRGPAGWILPWIMPALLFICFSKTLAQAGRENGP